MTSAPITLKQNIDIYHSRICNISHTFGQRTHAYYYVVNITRGGIMEDNVLDTLKDSSLDLVDGGVEFLPKLLIAILLLLVGFFVAKAVSKLVGKAVDYVENSKPVTATLSSIGVKSVDIDSIVELFVKWSIILIFLSASVDVLELDPLTQTFNSLVEFIPNILAAVAVAGLTIFAGNAMYDIVFQSAEKARVNGHKTLAKISQIAVWVFGLPLAAAQLGLDLTIVTNNITVVVAGVMLAFALAFGLGGRDTAAKIVSDLHKNWKK